MESVLIRKPFDPHVHGRDGALLKAVAPLTADQCWGAIFEPNLIPPITLRMQGQAYLDRIRDACASTNPGFVPYLLCYLTDSLGPAAFFEALMDGTFIGAKFYPQNATTNSKDGIADVTTLYTPGTNQFICLRVLALAKKVLQLHCELNFDFDGHELDPYDKEAYFFREVLPRIIDAHPDLKISCEHITCTEAANFMLTNANERLGCSITAHHLMLDRRDVFRGGLRPHLHCLPVIKREEDQMTLLQLATMRSPFVWAGTDSAPHDRRKKESDCCSGGVFTAHAGIELYAESFDSIHCVDTRFEDFVSVNGPLFYGLTPSEERVELVRCDWEYPEPVQYSPDDLDVIWPFGYHPEYAQRHTFRWKLSA